jgi:endogenous inhibitor of DNA gyrase (YacG/DUF329 family)
MSWNCSNCGQDVWDVDTEENHIWVGEEDIGWLCGECKQRVEWKPLSPLYNEDGEYVGR